MADPKTARLVDRFTSGYGFSEQKQRPSFVLINHNRDRAQAVLSGGTPKSRSRGMRNGFRELPLGF
jgi:hypothetical protein